MPLDPLEITGSLAIGTGLGGAIKDTVDPRLQHFKNTQWQAHTDVPLDAETAAEVAAEDVAKHDLMKLEATLTGIEGARFEDLYGLALSAPGEGTLLQLLRRNGEVPIDFAHGLRKAKLEPQWDDALRNLRDVRIPATDLAYMVVRDLVPDPFGFDGPKGPNDGTISDIPQLNIDTLNEASLTGWDRQRFEALVGRSGLAPAPVTAANAYFRGYADYQQYLTMIKKGDLRPAYANVILNTARQILTANQYAELELRGFYTTKHRQDQTALHGMSTADSDDLYNVLGRAPSDRQVYIGLARGAKWPSTYADVPEPFRSAIQRSDIRPEWADIVYQNRYSLPSAFVVRSLLTDGAIDQARGQTILEHEGWPPDLAQIVSSHYAAKAGGSADAHVTKAQNQLWTTAHRSYVGEMIDNPTATAAITAAGATAAAAPQILTLWGHERSLIRKQLTPAQIKKAFRDGIFTQAQATTELLARGYDQADATVLLEE